MKTVLTAGLAAVLVLTTSAADARGHRRHHHRHHHHHSIRYHRAPIDAGTLPHVDSTLLAEASRFLGHSNFTGFRGAWCGAAMGYWAKAVGKPLPRDFRLARSWAHAGQRLSGPAVGALAIFPHHVTLVAGRTADGRIIGVGGNQKGRRVTASTYNPHRAIAFVKL